MPSLRHNADKERHLTLATLAHCPRHYQYINEVRMGVRGDMPPTTALTIGVMAHVGLRELWKQRQTAGVWTPSLMLDEMDQQPEAAVAALQILKDGPAAYKSLKGGVMEYVAHWTGVRDDWEPLAVAPEDIPPKPWTILDGWFASYPDLVTKTNREAVLVVDHKTSTWRFEADKWEWHPELLTQCLAAQQLKPSETVFYQIDYLQRPGERRGSGMVWSFPVTPVWEFSDEKAAAAWEWLGHLKSRLDDYRQVYQARPWPQELSQCQTQWGLCGYYKECFKKQEEDLGGGECSTTR